MKRQYMVRRVNAASPWFYGYVRYRKWYGWGDWMMCTDVATDRKIVEGYLDKYEAGQPDTYLYSPQAQRQLGGMAK